MEDLYQKLEDVFKFFTTDTLTGLPLTIGTFTCIPLMSSDFEHAGYLISKGPEMHFFPAESIKKILCGNENTNPDMEILIEEHWRVKRNMCLN